MLERMGVAAISADSGEAATRLFEEHEEISAVVLDLTMRGKDGVETFRELRQRREDVRVILTSALQRAGGDTALRRAGAGRVSPRAVLVGRPPRPLATVLSW
ncbi:MAG: response regulator [Ilumatobacteraceae bacterium]